LKAEENYLHVPTALMMDIGETPECNGGQSIAVDIAGPLKSYGQRFLLDINKKCPPYCLRLWVRGSGFGIQPSRQPK
jgi:hypothetical protein